MNDISLNKKKKNIKFFDEKKYEMINSFNLDFTCDKVNNILSIYEEDKNHKLNHPLLLNGKYCLFCHDKSIKNIFFLEFIHKKIDLEEFLINNGTASCDIKFGTPLSESMINEKLEIII